MSDGQLALPPPRSRQLAWWTELGWYANAIYGEDVDLGPLAETITVWRGLGVCGLCGTSIWTMSDPDTFGEAPTVFQFGSHPHRLACPDPAHSVHVCAVVVPHLITPMCKMHRRAGLVHAGLRHAIEINPDRRWEGPVS